MKREGRKRGDSIQGDHNHQWLLYGFSAREIGFDILGRDEVESVEQFFLPGLRVDAVVVVVEERTVDVDGEEDVGRPRELFVDNRCRDNLGEEIKSLCEWDRSKAWWFEWNLDTALNDDGTLPCRLS